ncbi:MAG TPA: RagB/SusD family nutrient uptake outer membrane protein [Flavisolibacter sp.]|nr:RagB/SusD family nutrient uptake outer membrane protein [Flavisolibacter sp.]
MIKHSKKAFIAVLALSLFSCKKVIDVKETDFIGGDIALQTVNNNEQGIVGAYAGTGIEMDILFNAVMSDEVKVGEFYNAATVHEWQFSPTDISIRDSYTAITPLYRIIDRVNRVLQALPKAQATQASDEALRTKLKGEALFLRAFAHFELVRYYSGNYDANGLAMAYMETPSLTPTVRINMGPYFEKINADLAEAKSLVPSGLTDVTRANKIAVAGLQARVALYMKDWQKAIDYSTEYINALPLASKADFPKIWTDASNAEVAFKLKRTATTGGKIGSLFRGTSASATQIGTVTWLASDKIWNSYDQSNDVRFASYFKDETALSSANRPSHLIAKYAGTAYGTSNENVADAKVFRTGEMYLIRAEAKAEKNDLIGAALDLNDLRAARITGYVPEVFASKEALIDAVITERFKELAYEGHRFWDLKRRNLPVQRLASDAPNANAVTLPAGNFRFLLPIPSVEIQANPAIQQNPGYER